MNISVIIPSRNRIDYIQALLQDLSIQSKKPAEIIVIDQSDKPYNLTNCIYRHLPSTGPCKARNKGIEIAKGDLFVFLDDDISIGPNFIEEITKPIYDNIACAVAGANCDENKKYKYNNPFSYLEAPSSNWLKVFTSNPNFPGNKYSISFPGGCSAIKKEVLNQIGVFDEFFDPSGAGEDREIAVRLYKHGFNIYYNGKAAIQHFAAPDGGSRDVDSRSLMLDVNLSYIIGKHFSMNLFHSYRRFLLQEYWAKVKIVFPKLKGLRTKYQLYIRLKKELSRVEKILFT